MSWHVPVFRMALFRSILRTRRSRRCSLRFLFLCALAITTACESGSDSDVPPETRAEVEQVVGDADEGPASFGDVRGIAVDRGNRLYVLDYKDQQVRMFDSLGRFVRAIGRNGRGPGEFSQPNGLALDPRDHLVVYDPSNARASVFDTAGALETTHMISITFYGYIWEGGIDSAGRMLDLQMTPVNNEPHYFIRRLDFASAVEDSFSRPDCGIARAPFYRFPSGGMGVPHGHGLHTWIDPAGALWCAETKDAKAWRVPFGSDAPTDSLVSTAQPAPVTSSERDSAVASVKRFAKMVGDAPVDLSLIPSTKPLLLGMDRGADGRIWMHVEDAAGRVLHGFAPDGRWTDRVRLPVRPSRYHHMVIRDDRIWAFTVDSLGVPVVVRMRMGK